MNFLLGVVVGTIFGFIVCALVVAGDDRGGKS